MGATSSGGLGIGEHQVSSLSRGQSTQQPRTGDTAHRCAINRRGRITLPREIRVRLGVKPGDKVLWTLLNDETIVLRSKATLLAELARALTNLAGQRPSSKT
jgi:AbrB family looped-hinge helix DNA binding protein